MDDEDIVWLNMINQQRHGKSLKDKKNVPPINYSQFEMAMDRLEKESSFEQTNKRLSIIKSLIMELVNHMKLVEIIRYCLAVE